MMMSSVGRRRLYAVLVAAAASAAGSEAPPPGHAVPCARRSLVASGRPLASFARFATVAVDPADAEEDADNPAACELSRELLLRLLEDRAAEADALSAPLPAGFFERRAVARQDCGAVESIGRNITAALLEYQADCFRIWAGGARCSLKRSLGAPWDQLLDTPLNWTGAGLGACEANGTADGASGGEFGDYTANTSFKCAFCGASAAWGSVDANDCASPAIVRLSVCPVEAWWPAALSVAQDALSICQSDAACASLCYGFDEWNRTQSHVARQALLPLLLDAAGRRGREVPLTEAVDLVRSVLVPLDEVAQQCWQNPKCADDSVTGSINVTSHLCASCPAYPAAMASLVGAAGGLLPSEYARQLSAYCPSRTPAARRCEAALEDYAHLCESHRYWDLCRRQTRVMRDAALGGRMYDSCSEPNLGAYFDQVDAVNVACSLQPTFRNLSDRGGSVCDAFCTYQNATDIPWQDHCVLPGEIAVAFGAHSSLLFLAIAVAMASFVHFDRLCDRTRQRFSAPRWFSAADMTTDVCRSRVVSEGVRGSERESEGERASEREREGEGEGEREGESE